MPPPESTTYRVTQYALPDPMRPPRNIGVVDLESLVTHHPLANRRGKLVDGIPTEVEHSDNRSYAVIGAELQEVQALRTDKQYRSLAPDQVLLIKDFILGDPTASDSRRVDVPAPAAGIIGRVDPRNGVVDILDATDRALVARIRHLGPIAVAVGDDVDYGQSLGTQNNIGLPRSAGKHVHIEMDTRHYRQLDNYIRDLVDGRLPVEAAHRAGVQPRPVVDDGIVRIGGSGERVAMVQQALVAQGYRAVGGAPIPVDGVYRLSMQGAVLAFQESHGLAGTGDIDASTWRAAVDVALGKPLLPPSVHDSSLQPGARGSFRLLDQIRGHLREYEARRGDGPDADTERLALALAGRAAEQRLTSADHVVFAASADGARSGVRLIAIQGRLDDPAQRRASLSVADALATPPDASLRRLEAAEEVAPAIAPDLRQHAALSGPPRVTAAL